MSGRGRLRFWLLNAALALVSAAVGLAAVDWLAGRILSRPRPRYPLPIFSYAAAGTDLPRNSRGFRDFEYTGHKPPGVFRILVVGDSFAVGRGVNFDDAFPKRLERYLNYMGKTEPDTYQVINAGVSQRSTPQEAALVEKLSAELRPDLVIVQYCLNDAEDWDNPSLVMAMRKRYRAELVQEPEGPAGFLFKRSNLARLMISRINNSLSFRHQKSYYRALYENDNPGWEKTKAAFSRLARFSQANQVPVAVVVFPLLSFGLGGRYPFADIHRRVIEVARRAGLKHLDLLPAYDGLERLQLEAVPYDDPHPNELGHRIAAEALWSYIIRQKLAPAERSPKDVKNKKPIPTPFDVNPSAAVPLPKKAGP